VKRQQLLGEPLVARQHQPARVAAGVGQAQQFEIAHHVLVERGDTGKGLDEVEHDVRLEMAGGAADTAQVVADAEHAHLVTGLAQGLDHVVLHLPLGFEHVDAGRVAGRHEVLVDQREHALGLHRNSLWPPLCR
jgi:hypothetical protein